MPAILVTPHLRCEMLLGVTGMIKALVMDHAEVLELRSPLRYLVRWHQGRPFLERVAMFYVTLPCEETTGF